jgi:hypothetical protein
MDSRIIFTGWESRLVLAGEGIWDCFGVFRGDIWALTEQGPLQRLCVCLVFADIALYLFYLKQRVVLLF